MPQLTPGDRPPTFRLKDQRGRDVALDDLRGTRTVLYFFPKADTAG